nr:MAG TPA: hypothetical protein [Caudoviricetes sp.]
MLNFHFAFSLPYNLLYYYIITITLYINTIPIITII